MQKTIVAFALILGAPVVAQDAAELFVAKEVLARLQPLSFEKRREYCGYIGYTADGVLSATTATPGDQASCGAPFPRDMAVTASYHTHGAFDEDYFNEVPSIVDMEGDAEFYMNGYVSTPGGRMWYIDSQAMTATQICGLGCLPAAEGFIKGNNGEIATFYTYDTLSAKIGD